MVEAITDPSKQPVPADRDDFFVGYMPVPARLSRWLKRVVAVLGAMVLIAASVIAALQTDPGDAVWKIDEIESWEGVLIAKPYPMLVVMQRDGTMRIHLLVSEGKQGAAQWLPAFALRMYYELPDDSYASHFHHCMGPMPGRGTLKFRMSVLSRPEDKPPRSLPPTLPVLFTICLQRPGCDTPDLPVSNTYAGLIDLI